MGRSSSSRRARTGRRSRSPFVRNSVRRAGALALVAAAVAAGDGLAAPPKTVLLLSGETRLSAEPPLLSDLRLQEKRWRGRIRSDERVVVGVDGNGRPIAVHVLQRLVVGGKGDYV